MSVKERNCINVAGHIIRPLEHLRADINQKGIGRPAADDHNLVDVMVQ